jgi:uncharacterized membrane protein YraQ (UPF0718 family)
MVAALMGIKACLIYGIVTFSASILFGVVLEKAGYDAHVKNVRMKNCCESQNNQVPATFAGKFKTAFASAWVDFKGVVPFLFIGVGIGAGIYGYLPQDVVASLAGPDNPLAIPVAALVGIPLYIRAETAIPIGLALSQKGMSLGAVIALIVGGAGMAIPEMSMLAGIFKKRLVTAIVTTIFATAVIGGYVFNTLLA